MKQVGGVIGIMVLSLFASTVSASDDDGLAAALRGVVEKNLAAFNREDVQTTLQTIDTRSPEYSSMQQALPEQFAALDARTELVDFRYVGHDDEFAVARVKYRTVDSSDEQFMANILDTMTLFHQENGVWKYWGNYVLGGTIISPSE
ncbi:MAG: hypothetical protein V2I26_10155 [Halieaceae bacterium]|jgi:hypothetical protein|nr:hypothetical protein [Halieaceae bacterium]